MSKIPLMDKYMEGFRNYSYFNDFAGELSYFVIMGQLLKGIVTIPRGGSWIDPRVSVMWVQEIRSGKSESWQYVFEICRLLNVNTVELDEFSDTYLVGGYEEPAKRGGEPRRIAGALAGDGIMHFDEASVLLLNKNYSQSGMTFLQKALNPIGSEINKITKGVKHGTIEVRSEKSLWLTTYPPKELVKEVFFRGLFQRLIFFPRHVDNEFRVKASERQAETIWKAAEVKPIIDDMVTEFLKIREFYNNLAKQGVTLKPAKDYVPYMKNKYRKYFELIANIKPDIQEIMVAFIPNIQNYLAIFATHIAASRKSKVIELKDFEIAHKYMIEIMKAIMVWLEDQIRTTKKYLTNVGRQSRIRDIYKEMKKDKDGWVLKSELMKHYQKLDKLSFPTIYKIISEDEGWEEKTKNRNRYIKLIQSPKQV